MNTDDNVPTSNVPMGSINPFGTPTKYRKFGSLSSSSDPQQLAATVSGLILTLSATIIAIAQHYGFPLTQNAVASFAEQAGLAIGALWFLFGLIRKAVVAIQQKFQ